MAVNGYYGIVKQVKLVGEMHCFYIIAYNDLSQHTISIYINNISKYW